MQEIKKRKYISLFEVQKLLDETVYTRHPERNRCLIYLLFYHGLRASEALSLPWSSFDFQQKTLYVCRIKSGFSTIHPLTDNGIIWLKQWKELSKNQHFIFPGKSPDRPLSRQRLYQFLRTLSQNAKLPLLVHPHMLRHACGYELANQRCDTRLIQDYLGHRNIRHTVRYTASNPARFKNVWDNISLI
ncbi:tyrosine-type recombinase/integrase [Providencia vermicola]|uniref:tyrosine-type recombinase/integrase n=1 Tax=Providencia vermicola TaxID=333965 RepID=UPI002AB565C7|nr:tyrosine-type recombinase/integrase [Providencia stuartii]